MYLTNYKAGQSSKECFEHIVKNLPCSTFVFGKYDKFKH